MLNLKTIKAWVFLPAVCLSISACDVVKLDAAGHPIIPVSAEEATSIKNMSPQQLADKFWPDIVKEATHKAVSLKDVKELDGKKHRFVKLTGVVNSVDDKKRAATIDVTSNGQHVLLQIGPIIRGNSIRDSASFISFDEFKNQVQYARLSKALNKKAMAHFSRPDSTWKGKNVDILAAVTVDSHQLKEAIPLEIVKR